MKLFVFAAAALLPVAAASLDTDKGKTVGNAGAPLTIELFSDFQCPSCKALHDQIMPQLMQEYVATGKVYLIEHDFPLQMHNHSREAAYYATAAAKLGKYQQVGDALFRDQAGWSVTGKVWETVATALTPAEQKKVQTMAKDPAIMAEVQKDVDMGNSYRVNQTPTMIIRQGMRIFPVAGSVNYSILKSFLDDRLKQK
ncbi:MAG TPA: thioredoxin domain-containing protein [Bryobacteraceae bacterium]|jgi:protein-disulfide isomerase